MEIFKRKWSELSGGRFDPLYLLYGSQAFLKNTNFSIKTLGSVIQSIKTGFAAGKNDQSDSTKGIIQIRPTNLDENGILKFEKNIYIPRGVSSEHLITKGEVLFNNTNSQELVGKTAYFDLEGNFVSSNHITRIKTDIEQLLPQYLSILLNIYQKNKVFFNTCVNWNNQSGINIEFLKSYVIPLPPLETQQHIIDIMDNAYNLKKQKEQEAKELLDSIDKYLLSELGITLPNPQTHLQNRIWTAKFSELSGARFDPSYHQNYYKQLELALENGKYGVEKIKNLFDCVLNFSSLNCDNPCYIEIGDIDVSNANISYKNILKDKLPKNTKITIENGDLLISMVRPTRGAIAVYEGEKQAYCSGAFCVLREREYNKNVLQYILRSIIFRNLFEKYATGSTYPTIKNEDILNLKVPLPPLAIQEKIAEEIQKRKQKALKLTEEAKGLLEQAKKQVESMILGG